MARRIKIHLSKSKIDTACGPGLWSGNTIKSKDGTNPNNPYNRTSRNRRDGAFVGLTTEMKNWKRLFWLSLSFLALDKRCPWLLCSATRMIRMIRSHAKKEGLLDWLSSFRNWSRLHFTAKQPSRREKLLVSHIEKEALIHPNDLLHTSISFANAPDTNVVLMRGGWNTSP